jgi:hypothetical protein
MIILIKSEIRYYGKYGDRGWAKLVEMLLAPVVAVRNLRIAALKKKLRKKKGLGSIS